MGELELRTRPPVRLEPDQEWWVDYRYRLAARVREDRTVVELRRWELAPGLYGSVVRRLEPRPPAWRKPVLIGAGALLALLVVLWVAVALWPLLVALGLAGVGLRVVAGHRPTCAGLHCPGCRR